MVSTIPVSENFSLNSTEDSKERILFTLQVAVKQIQHCSSLESEGVGVTLQVKEVRQLCETLDKALFHGLKCYDKGYWPFVKQFTHRSTVDFLQNLEHAHSDVQRGRAWLTLALNEASLESYFRSFAQNLQLMKKHYKSLALLCDEQRMQLVLMLMAGLEFVPIDIDTEKLSFGSGLSFFKVSSKNQDSSVFENHERHRKVSQTEWATNLDVIPCDNAAEVTCDFQVSGDKTSPERQRPSDFSAALTTSSKTNSTKTVSPDELEMISHYINISPESEAKSSEDLEVVRTKVVRRTKRSASQKGTSSNPETPTDSKTQSDDSNSSLENRLSKTTTDSGLCLETPYSTDSDSVDFAGDGANEYEDTHRVAFHVNVFQKDISVTFSTPKRKVSSAKSEDSKCSSEGVIEDPIRDSHDSRPSLVVDGNQSNDSNEDLEEEEISIYDLHKVPYVFKSAPLVPSTEQKTETCNKNSEMRVNCEKQETVDLVLEEVAKLEKPQTFDLKVGNNILLYFLVEVYEHEEECFYKLFCGYSHFPEGYYERIYFLLTNKSIYFLKPGDSAQKFYKCASIRYSSINHTLVDLNYQSFKIMSSDRKYFPLYTANAELTRYLDIVKLTSQTSIKVASAHEV